MLLSLNRRIISLIFFLNQSYHIPHKKSTFNKEQSLVTQHSDGGWYRHRKKERAE